MSKDKKPPNNGSENEDSLNLSFDELMKRALNTKIQPDTMQRVVLSDKKRTHFGSLPKGTKAIIIHDCEFINSSITYAMFYTYRHPEITVKSATKITDPKNEKFKEIVIELKNNAKLNFGGIYPETFDSYYFEITTDNADDKINGEIHLYFNFKVR